MSSPRKLPLVMDTPKDSIWSLATSPLEYKLPQKLNGSFDTDLDGYYTPPEEDKIERPDFHDTTWESKFPFP